MVHQTECHDIYTLLLSIWGVPSSSLSQDTIYLEDFCDFLQNSAGLVLYQPAQFIINSLLVCQFIQHYITFTVDMKVVKSLIN